MAEPSRSISDRRPRWVYRDGGRDQRQAELARQRPKGLELLEAREGEEDLASVDDAQAGDEVPQRGDLIFASAGHGLRRLAAAGMRASRRHGPRAAISIGADAPGSNDGIPMHQRAGRAS